MLVKLIPGSFVVSCSRSADDGGLDILLLLFIVLSTLAFSNVDKCENVSNTPEKAQCRQSNTPVKVLG